MLKKFDIPIIVVAYNRPLSLIRILDSLQKAEYPYSVTLIISIDKSDSNEVAKIAEKFRWMHGKKEVVHYEEHIGLRGHIIASGDISQNHDAVIILEDDLYVSPGFYYYTIQAFDFYRDDKKLGGLSLFSHSYNETAQLPFVPLIDDSDVFFMQIASSWGQCWSKEQWGDFKQWYEEQKDELFDLCTGIPINVADWPTTSWKKYFMKYLIDKEKYFVYPRFSLTTNFGDPGVHFHKKLYFQHVPLLATNRNFNFKNLQYSHSVYDANCEIIPRCLNLLQSDLNKYDYTVDLYGVKSIYQIKTRFVLTSRYCTEHIKSYAMELKPIEYNIIRNIQGNEISLALTRFCDMQIHPVYLLEKNLFYYYNLRDYQIKFSIANQKEKVYTTNEFIQALINKAINLINKNFIRLFR